MEAVTGVRRAELIGVLSLATDLAMGQPLEHGLRTALIAVRIGTELALDDRTLEDVYYVSLLQYVGCTAESHLDAEVWGDELAARGEMVSALLGSQAGLFATGLRNIHADAGPLRRAGQVLRRAPRMRETLSDWALGHCEVSAMLAERLSLGLGVKEALAHLYERWDGRGFPGRIGGDDVPLPVRVMQVAHDADLNSAAGPKAPSRSSAPGPGGDSTPPWWPPSSGQRGRRWRCSTRRRSGASSSLPSRDAGRCWSGTRSTWACARSPTSRT